VTIIGVDGGVSAIACVCDGAFEPQIIDNVSRAIPDKELGASVTALIIAAIAVANALLRIYKTKQPIQR
jgi:hypothetical protein